MVTRMWQCTLTSLVFFILSIGYFSPAYAAAAPSIGQMVWVKGTIQATGSDHVARTLSRRSPIFEHDTIETGSGTGEIVFTDNSLVTLRSGTTFRVDEYKFSGAGSGDNRYVAGLAKGGFRTITGLISHGNPDNYQVNTPVATIGVRGTDYSIFYGAQGLAVKLSRGAIFVENRAGKAELNVARDRVYALISDLNHPPAVQAQEPKVFNGQPDITHASFIAPSSGGSEPPGSGGTAAGGGSASGGGGGNSICVTP